MAKTGRGRGRAHGAATPAVTALETAGVPYTLHTFEVDLDAGGERFGVQVARAMGVPPERMFKTLMVAAPDGGLAACVVPVSGQLDLRAAAAVLGVKRLALADLALVERRTGYVRGGVSPLGQRHRHPVLLDSSALDAPVMYVSGGQRGLDLELAPADLAAATDAVVAPIAAR
ncbi:Cys-tRNA(Pro) deacylase [Micrococcus endophyticus]|uniref:Cys-tRNA(Pro)/Cys-tRNA(Cys) deacylase n=1 Tax=Micrococcus endophyticus TaxID=455343 RepID=A0A7W9JHY9_9MICC|nr:Cys-tRNA(Pro)/Cys-tRNA(Cys) deacylase [Micrococcus endophyticus]